MRRSKCLISIAVRFRHYSPDPSPSRRQVSVKRAGAIGSAISLSILPGLLWANVVVDVPASSGSAIFTRQVNAALAILERFQDAPIRQLHAAVVASPATMVISVPSRYLSAEAGRVIRLSGRMWCRRNLSPSLFF
jgi:hypothetical protein